MIATFTNSEARHACHLYARWLRREADKKGSHILYQLAAAEFRALGMDLAAERCEEKAKHYKERACTV